MIGNLAKEKLKASIRIEDVIDHLDLRHKLGLKPVGGYLVGKCITGHDSKSAQCCKLGPGWGHLHCFSCNESFDIIELIQREKGLNFVESCKYLAETFRSDLLEELQRGSFLAPETKSTYTASHLYEMIFQYGKELLYTPKGKEALDYLVEIRGYDPTKLQSTEWIYWPEDAEIRKHLKSKLPKEKQQEAASIKLNGNGGDLFRTALPYRDRFGKILGFAKRATIKEGVPDAEGKTHRWSYTSGLKKDDPFNIYRCRREKQLILVEGLPDAAYLPSLGIKNIAATGQGELSAKHIESLKIYEIESVVIVFDNDGKDSKGEIGSIEKAKKASELLEKNGIEAFILPPHLLAPFKDPDEYVKANGPEAFKKLVAEKAQARVRWLPSYFAYKYDLGTDIGRFSALGVASKAYARIEDDFSKGIFKQEIENIFGLPANEIDNVLAKALKEQQSQDDAEKYKQSVDEAQKLISQGDLNKATQLLSKLKKEDKAEDFRLKPYTVENLKADLSKIQEGLKTGYKSIDSTIQIPQEAITIIAGRPSHGKTTTLLNFFVNMVKLYPEREFYFFSYEEPKNQILLKILNILSGEFINEANNLANLEGYLRGGINKLPKINEAMATLQSWTESHRLVVCDHPFFVDDLGREIARLKERGKMGAIFIDYIQKIKFRGKASTRQLELQKISETILETAKFNSVPIILGAQLGRGNTKAEVLRLDNLREAGDIENDAKLVLGIWNGSKETADGKGETLASRKIDLDLVVLKNRNGPSNQTISLVFDRPLSTLKEKS
ncbi:MAG: toprim domain-containing protein [Rhabdochlamydiaceae bacterium]|nr:toprim domain-containing protein [Rhabdochlamydiaceae bacterium]